MKPRLLFPCIAFLFAASIAVGQVSYTNQSRTISAHGAGADSVPQSASAPDFADWTSTVSSSGSQGSGSASQSSSLGPWLASLDLFASAESSGGASSSCSFTFTATAAMTVKISGSARVSTFALSGPGVSIFRSYGTTVSAVSDVAVLQSGQSYTFASTANMLVGSQSGFMSATIAFGLVQGHSFIYQGIVRNGSGQAVSTPTDMLFRLFPHPILSSAQVGPTLSADAVAVQGGVFTRELDFGDVFDGTELWLEVSVRNPAGSGEYTTVLPRTRVGSMPYASYALKSAYAANAAAAASAASANSVPWAGVTGIPSNVTGAFSPWFAAGGGIAYVDGSVGIGTAGPQARLHVTGGDLQIDSNNFLRFGAAGENGDTIGFQRTFFNTGQSVLSLVMGSPANGNDAFLIQTSTGQTLFQFNTQSNGQALKAGGGSWGVLSDARAKHGIVPLEASLERLLKLRGRSYFYNDPTAAGAGNGQHTGFVAQEVESIFPEWIGSTASGLKTLNITGFEALAVEALRELRAEKNAELSNLRVESEAKLAEKQREIDDLKRRLERVEKAVSLPR
ncbi:MAG: tail fiber domain-containing protein [Phycisphaerales bacterium]